MAVLNAQSLYGGSAGPARSSSVNPNSIYNTAGANSAPALPDFTFGSQPLGYAGFNSFVPTRAKGTPFGPGEIEKAYGAPYGYIAQGASQAEGALREGAYDRFRARVTGYAGGRAEEGRRLANDAAASGYSPELLRRQAFARGAQDQAFYGQESGDRDALISEVTAELRNNTGVEFAALSEAQRAEVVNNYLNYKARAAARSGGKLGGLGSLIGTVAGSFLGPVGAAAGGALGSSLFGSGSGVDAETGTAIGPDYSYGQGPRRN
jgi:hypothetical protein